MSAPVVGGPLAAVGGVLLFGSLWTAGWLRQRYPRGEDVLTVPIPVWLAAACGARSGIRRLDVVALGIQAGGLLGMTTVIWLALTVHSPVAYQAGIFLITVVSLLPGAILGFAAWITWLLRRRSDVPIIPAVHCPRCGNTEVLPPTAEQLQTFLRLQRLRHSLFYPRVVVAFLILVGLLVLVPGPAQRQLGWLALLSVAVVVFDPVLWMAKRGRSRLGVYRCAGCGNEWDQLTEARLQWEQWKSNRRRRAVGNLP